MPLTVAPIDDAAAESPETVIATLAAGLYGIGAPNSATVTIADDDTNLAPSITLLSPTVTNAAIPNTATGLLLEATVTDDGRPLVPGAVTTAWTKLSGPGTVTFDNTAAATTGARFSAAGVYVLRLTANDGEFAATRDLRVTVAPTVAASLQAGDVGTGRGGSSVTGDGAEAAAFGLRQSSGALAGLLESGRGLPHSKTLPRFSPASKPSTT